ncbi:MAG: hypothetical protein A3H69_00225 [Candidatus Sungbacteria bacterium RIFCSPLOWO2_02_FULL_47_9]|nr:MAG: hypothetical protein A3D57_03660 [Candidatus Sungbacteria bacterium RIFCSPHIGHO2_02_FULL_46_12]OHA10617.1 MAG: hypothetical protein A3H69_00225 [Candidatus Sungbacteria bacterium RIFCSPLOWO2_02_FULL_47_9]
MTFFVGTKNVKRCGLCGKKFQLVPKDSAWLFKTIKDMASMAMRNACNATVPHAPHRGYHEYGIMFNPAGRVGCNCTHKAHEFLESVLILFSEPRKLKKILRRR